MELHFPLRLPEMASGRSTNRNKAVCLWVTGYVPTPTCYPTLGMYFKGIKFLMITGRCGTWCTVHLRNGPACVLSLSYGSIKHFIIKHYSKQSVSLKGEGEENKTGECMFYPLYHHVSTLAVLRLRCTLMEPQPQYKNRSKGNQQSICPSWNAFHHLLLLFFLFNYLNSYNMMFGINYIFPIMLNGWTFERWRGARRRG